MNDSSMKLKSGRARRSVSLLLALGLGLGAGVTQAANLTFLVGSTNGVTNSQVVVPIRASHFTNISSFQFSFHWNTNVAAVMGVEQFGLPGMAGPDFGVFTNGGTITATWIEPNAGTTNLPDGAMVFGVRFRLVGPAAASSPVTVDGTPTMVLAGDENFAAVPVSVVNGTLTIDRTLIVTCATNKTVECGSVWSFNPPLVTDSCGGLGASISILSTVTNSSGNCGFTATRTWEIIDSCSNRTTCAQLVTAIDTTPPVAVCALNKTIEFGQAWSFDAPTAMDSCNGTNLTIQIISTLTNAGPCGPGFTATRHWQIADGCNNTTNCTQVVSVRDTTAPQITCALNKTVNCLAPWSFDPPSAFDAGDGTSAAITVFNTITNGSCGNGFAAIRTWRAVDACGNSSTCTQTVSGRAIVTVGGALFNPTNYPPNLTDKFVEGATVLGPTNSTAASLVDGSYNLVFDAANSVVISPTAPTGGNPSDGVTTLDISLTRRHILAVASLDSPYKLLAADVDGSGSISTLDLSFMRRLVLGVTNRFPAGLWRFIPADFSFTNVLSPWGAPTSRTYPSVSSSLAGQDFIALKLGDVNNSWTPPAGLAGSPKKLAEVDKGAGAVGDPVTFTVGSASGLPGTDVLVPVRVSNFTDIRTFQFSFHWNTGVVTFLNVEQFGLSGLSVGNFGTINTNAGRLTVSWDDTSGGTVTLPDATAIFFVKFKCSGAPSNTTSLIIDGTPTPFDVTDGFDMSVAHGAIAGQIYVGQPNRAPVLTSIGDKSVNEGDSLTFTASATDPDGAGQTQTFTLEPGAPAGTSIDPNTGVFSWTPGESQGPGNFFVTVKVTDNGAPALNAMETILITVNEVNQAPVLGVFGNQAIDEGVLFTFNAAATDADLPAQSLTYSLSNAPAGASIGSASGVFSWTPSESQGPGSYDVTVRVNDNGSPVLNNTRVITLTVNEVNTAPLLTAIGNKTVNEGSQLTFTAAATDADLPAQALAFALDASAPAGATITPGGLFTWTPTEAQGPQTYFVMVRVTDNGSPQFSATNTVLIDVREATTAPVLATIGSKTNSEGSLIMFTATATDADLPAQILTYSLSNAPAGASINPITGVFSWTPSEAQGPSNYVVTVRVTDDGSPSSSDSETITLAITEVTSAPVLASIGNKQVNEGSLLTFTATATDADLPAQTLTYSLDAGAPSGAAINAASGVFTWTPTEAQGPGNYPITLRVTDNGSPATSATESISILVNEVNLAPVLSLIGNKTNSEGTLLTFTATATDGDVPAQSLSYSLSNAPSGAVIDPANGVFTWTPTEAQGPSTNLVTVMVSDGALTASETITIVITEVNLAPVLTAIGTKSVGEGSPLTFTASTTDADLPAQTMTYSLSNAPVGAVINPASGAFTWTPSETQGPGNYVVTVRVTDNGTPALSASETITITVNEVNLAPVLTSIGAKSVNEGFQLAFTATATDADVPVNALTYSLLNAPAGASITAGGAFTWTPTEAQGGPSNYLVTVRVTDNGTPALSASEVVTITVNELNLSPVLGAIGPKSIGEGSLLTFTATATDADLPAQQFSYSLLNAPAGAVINNASGVFSWTPTEAQGPGVYSLTVRVTDNGSPALSASETISITVSEVNNAPVLAAIGTRSATQGSPMTFTATATDPDVPGQSLTYSLLNAPAGAAISANGVFTWTPNAVQGAGSYSVTVVVSDGTLTDTEVVTIDVTAFAAPSISILDPPPIPGGADGALVAEFEVVLSGPSPFAVSVDFATADGTAVAGHDYTTTSGRLVFPPGTTNLTVEVDVMGYSTIYTNRFFLVNLSQPTNAGGFGQSVGTGTINADPPPGLYISDMVAIEGDRGVSNHLFTVTLLNASTNVVTVNYATTNGTSLALKDFRPKKGKLKFLPGVTSLTIPVAIVGNLLNEADEFFRVNLSRPVNTVIIRGQGLGTILDNDPLPLVSIADVTAVEVNAGVRTVAFTLRLSAKSGRALSVDFATADDTAIAGTDYVATNGTVVFPAGALSKKITVGIIGNTVHEDAETFLLNLSNAVNATITDGSALGNIRDNDAIPAVPLGIRRVRRAP